MSIAVVGTPTTGSAANGGNITLSLPSGMQQNDVVYVFFGLSSAAGGGTSSSGWSQIGSTVDNTVRSQVFRKVMGASPDASIALTGSGSNTQSDAAVAIALRGVDTTTPEDATPTTATGSSTNPDSPSITSVSDLAMAIAFAVSRVVDASITVPSGYSNLVTTTASDNNSVTVAGATKALTTHGAEDPAAFGTWSTALWVAWTLAVMPDGAASAALSGSGALVADAKRQAPGAASLAAAGTLGADATVSVYVPPIPDVIMAPFRAR